MGKKTKIEWAEATWNPVTGCTPISEGCKNCYAERMATRMRGRYGYPEKEPFALTLHPGKLEQPLRWKRPRLIFVVSMGDLFHDDLKVHEIELVLSLTFQAPQHTYLFLTKRPDNMQFMMERFFKGQPMPENWWLGVTAENQRCADERIPILLQIPAAVRFVSYEPALGPINLRHMDVEVAGHEKWCWIDSLTGKHSDMGRPCPDVPRLDWIIAGGESGPGARPAKPDWFRSVRDQCKAAGVPFLFKQWGEHCMASQLPPDTYQRVDAAHNLGNQPDAFWKIGKKAAGRLLDGEEHLNWPRRPGK